MKKGCGCLVTIVLSVGVVLLFVKLVQMPEPTPEISLGRRTSSPAPSPAKKKPAEQVATPIAQRKEPLWDKSEETQAKRWTFMESMVEKGFFYKFHRLQSDGRPLYPRVWVTPLWRAQPVDGKELSMQIVLYYYCDGTTPTDCLVIINDRLTGKAIGDYGYRAGYGGWAETLKLK